MIFRGEFDFLSNFFVHPVQYGGTEWKSAEHAYQAEKACFDGDKFIIKDARTPALAKRWGRAVLMVPGWEQRKDAVMMEVVRAKFADPELADRLLKVQGEIVEHNHWHDNHFGSCTCHVCGDKGKNVLGRILMQVRDEIEGSLWRSHSKV